MICALVRLGIQASQFFVTIGSCLLLCLLSIPAFGQSASQQYVFANVPGTPSTSSTLASYAKDGQTGSLAIVPGAPFPDRLEGGRLAVDALGRFLFVLNFSTGGISMYQVNSSNGALTEVPGSPFSPGKTINLNQAPANPTSLATEKSGKYLYVGYTTGNFSNLSAITPFNIDATNLALTLTDQLSFDVPFNPVQMSSDPRGLFLYVVNGMNPFNGSLNGSATVYSITASDGSLALNGSAGGGSEGRVMAADPQGRFFFNGGGQFSGSIFWGVVSPLDGTSNPSTFLDLGENNFPIAMAVDSSGKFLYVQQSAGLVIYSIDQTTGQPAPVTAPLASPNFQLGNVVADPAGAFLYSGAAGGIRAFQIDSQNGSLTEITGSPFGAGGAVSNIAISGTPVQAISGPSAAFTPPSLNFGSVTEGQPVTLILHMVNDGGQTLAINLAAVGITGTNLSDFSQSTTCTAALAPNANCSFSVTFTPTATGTESASLQISDSAPGSPQSISLAGTGMAPSPSVAFVPGSITFNPIAQGTTEGPQAFQLTNIGSAPLHILSVTLGGPNPQDFAETNNCTPAPIAPNASCSINVSFMPQASGGRGATISIADDAPGSPQTLFLQGTGATPFLLNPAPQSSTTASITAGQTANYGLQLNPGTGFKGTVALACSGAPVGAKCNLSSSTLSVASPNPVAFTVTITTTGTSSAQSPWGWPLRFAWRNILLFAEAAFLWILWQLSSRRILRCAFLTAPVVLLLVAAGSGCGGGSVSGNAITTPPPAPQVTPKGSYSVTVTATAGNLTPQTITLTLNVN